MTSLYLVRHGQALGNLERRFQGHTDLELTPMGKAQARCLAMRFSAIPVDKVYSSPLQRASDTAAGIALVHRLAAVYEGELLEIDGGVFEDQAFDALWADYPEEMRVFNEEPYRFAAPGGESARAVYSRVSQGIFRLVQENRDRTLVAVSHGFAIRCFLCWASGYPLEDLNKIPWGGNTAVSHVIFDCMLRPHVVRLQDDSHLPPSLRRIRKLGDGPQEKLERKKELTV